MDQSQSQSKKPEYQVDMMSSAKDAQWSVDFLGSQEVVKAISPAKVNLFLAVGNKREDGYHEVVNIMHALALHDVLYVGRMVCFDDGTRPEQDGKDLFAFAGPNKNIKVSVDISNKTISMHDVAPKIPVADNLVFRAIDELAKLTNHTQSEEISIRIEKNIPMQAGLGGGSSNAASALCAVAKLWGIPAEDPSLVQAASTIGADAAFFLEGGCAEYVGAGEKLSHKLDPMKASLVVVKPPVGVSTKKAYEVFDSLGAQIPDALLTAAEGAKRACDVPLFNNLTPAAADIQPEIKNVISWLEAEKGVRLSDGRPDCLLCGSGSAIFAITETFADASAIAAKAKAKGLWARSTTFSSIRACAM